MKLNGHSGHGAVDGVEGWEDGFIKGAGDGGFEGCDVGLPDLVDVFDAGLVWWLRLLFCVAAALFSFDTELSLIGPSLVK